ncbi:serine/threonine protein kinase [Leptolyngbya sp. PCC 6406]|uniref:serine/threonine protein kinase n=1 Tax=Leptolyngbya sp. PCC 6406 TaxID=1173264 RepID=UPI0002ABDCBB|nr:serine/threonine-protein kinase [Leptolyngbya sp. PCC 6406]
MGGQILGDRYEVERQLGKKSGRWTLKARDLQTQTAVVLKVLFLDDTLDATDLKLFKREIEALKLLQHPDTPRYLDYFEIGLPQDGRALALAQTFMTGKSLATYLTEGRTLTQAEATAIAHRVLAVLVELHAYQPPLIHRDIRPSNILLRSEPISNTADIALVDFGSVKSLNPGTTSFTMVGTDGYIPPEQASGRVLAVSDLYALGATLVEVMTGISPTQLQTRGLRIDFESHAEVSAAFADWLKQLLSPGLEYRWSSAYAALEALEAIL